MDTFVRLPYERPDDIPPAFDGDVRTPPSFVEHFLRVFSDPGDAVLDPFAGFGTTLRVAERMDRTPFGIEYETDRAELVRERVEHAGNVQQGSVLELDPDDVPPIDICLTSPPFMVQGMTENPFENYAGESDYEQYLDDIETAFSNVADVMAPGGQVLIDVVNVKYDGDVTPLAFDIVDVVSAVLHFEGEVLVGWTGEGDPGRVGSFGYGYDHSYCLVFRNVE